MYVVVVRGETTDVKTIKCMCVVSAYNNKNDNTRYGWPLERKACFDYLLEQLSSVQLQ